KQMRDEILATIVDRGSDRSKRVLTFLFENYLQGSARPLKWQELWTKCWDEPLDSRRGASAQQSQTVRQAVYRLRDILDQYFASEPGQRWPHRAFIEPTKYFLRFKPNILPSE